MAYSLSRFPEGGFSPGIMARFPNPKSIVKTVVYITFLLRRLKTRSLRQKTLLLHSRDRAFIHKQTSLDSLSLSRVRLKYNYFRRRTYPFRLPFLRRLPTWGRRSRNVTKKPAPAVTCDVERAAGAPSNRLKPPPPTPPPPPESPLAGFRPFFPSPLLLLLLLLPTAAACRCRSCCCCCCSLY